MRVFVVGGGECNVRVAVACGDGEDARVACFLCVDHAHLPAVILRENHAHPCRERRVAGCADAHPRGGVADEGVERFLWRAWVAGYRHSHVLILVCGGFGEELRVVAFACGLRNHLLVRVAHRRVDLFSRRVLVRDGVGAHKRVRVGYEHVDCFGHCFVAHGDEHTCARPLAVCESMERASAQATPVCRVWVYWASSVTAPCALVVINEFAAFHFHEGGFAPYGVA